MAKSMFIKFNNEDGFIQVVCLQDRFIPDLESLGFVNNTEKLSKSVPTPEPKKFAEPKRIVKGKGKK